MNLVVVESPSKAKTINKYLGKDFIVKASKGHVVDLPKSKVGIDPENNFKPDYVVTNAKSLKELKAAYKGADKLILAVDLDREGEAIGWHVAQKLGAIDAKGKIKKDHKVERIVFSEITKTAITEALKHPRDIDMNLVNAQQARRFLDRLVGYGLSPVLWKKIMFGLSAGRVQSVALRLVVDKEDERNKFKSDEYWSLTAFASEKNKNKELTIEILKKEIEKDSGGAGDEEEDDSTGEKYDGLIPFELSKIDGKSNKLQIKNKKNTEDIVEEIKKEKFIITDVTKKMAKRYPKPPFITSTLQQTAVNFLGMSSKRTMMVAQKLYERGFITYMRTDSVAMSNDAIAQARSVIKKKFGPKYLPATANAYANKSKNSQEAHECIRPVDFNIDTDSSFSAEEEKVYRLIKNRAMASQMPPAETESVTAIVLLKDKYEFRATGSTIKFDGYMVLRVEKMKETILPELNKGQEVYPEMLQGVQHFTQPPARYSEASLIKKLEELGIGRPSTYSSIISTILSRKYVEKEGKYMWPTDVGIVVNKLLVTYFTNIVDYKFTSELEEELDSIAEGKLDWVKMLTDFYFPFEKTVKTKTDEIPRDEFTVLGEAPEDIKCPTCGSAMRIKLGRYGRFYTCSKWPECKGILSMDGTTQEQLEAKPQTEEFQRDYEPAPKTDDDRDFKLKKGKFGEFWAHPDYPKVKDARPLVLKPEKLREVYGEPPQTDDGRDYVIKSGRFGFFWTHPDYPKVKDIKKIAKK